MNHVEVDRRRTTDFRNQGKYIKLFVHLQLIFLRRKLQHFTIGTTDTHKMSGVNLLSPSKYC